MSLLALLAAGAGDGSPVDPSPSELPYAIPTTAPYNVPEHSVTPTDDETGQTIHPSVLDFGTEGWNGHRYWMTATAFYQAENPRENPHVYHSDDGFTWEWPDGVTNPLDPWPGEATDNYYQYNSDSHLAYDVDGDRLILTWREVWQQASGRQTIYARTSTDGSTWTPEVLVHQVTDDGGQMYSASQSLVRASSSEWRMYFSAGNGGAPWCRFFTSTDPLGPYSNPQQTPYSSDPVVPYHGDVVRIPDGRYLAIFQRSGYEYPAISTDGGETFVTKAAILQNGVYGGHQQNMYKATLALDPTTPGMVGVWYTTSHAAWGRWVCYTRVPLAAWTD